MQSCASSDGVASKTFLSREMWTEKVWENNTTREGEEVMRRQLKIKMNGEKSRLSFSTSFHFSLSFHHISTISTIIFRWWIVLCSLLISIASFTNIFYQSVMFQGYYKDTVEFFFEGRNECKNFWKKCVENHGFFRCSSVKNVSRHKTRVLSRGSSFR